MAPHTCVRALATSRAVALAFILSYADTPVKYLAPALLMHLLLLLGPVTK